MNKILISKNIKLIKKFVDKIVFFSSRFPYANKEIRESWMNMVNATYNSTEDMIDKLQCLKGKKVKDCRSISNFRDEMNI